MSAHPLGLDVGLDFDSHKLLSIGAPVTMTLVPTPLIAADVGYDRFKAAVLARQIQIAVSKGGRHFPPVDGKAMAAVDEHSGGHGGQANGRAEAERMRKDAAAKCNELLAAVRGTLRTEGPKGISVGVLSGYRPYEKDRRLWNIYFVRYYGATAAKRSNLSGGPHGHQAIDLLARYIRKRKAAPGFSNHSNGNAVDFTTTEGKVRLISDTKDESRAAWRRSWFYKWLTKNAAAFSFKQLPTEEWHWDFQG